MPSGIDESQVVLQNVKGESVPTESSQLQKDVTERFHRGKSGVIDVKRMYNEGSQIQTRPSNMLGFGGDSWAPQTGTDAKGNPVYHKYSNADIEEMDTAIQEATSDANSRGLSGRGLDLVRRELNLSAKHAIKAATLAEGAIAKLHKKTRSDYPP